MPTKPLSLCMAVVFGSLGSSCSKKPQTKELGAVYKRLQINCNAVEAEVWVNEKFVGDCAQKIFRVDANDKWLRLEIHSDNHYSFYKMIEAKARPKPLNIKLVKNVDL